MGRCDGGERVCSGNYRDRAMPAYAQFSGMSARAFRRRRRSATMTGGSLEATAAALPARRGGGTGCPRELKARWRRLARREFWLSYGDAHRRA